MHQRFISLSKWLRIIITLLCLLFILTADANQNHLSDEISINSGSNGVSVSLDGRKWVGDTHSNFSIKGSSTKSSVVEESAVSVPYKTARISNSQFSYVFRVGSGQKLIRLHFNPVSYNGFKGSVDLFSVEAGPFTLLHNFSAWINADALGVNIVVKEFCVVIDENYPLNVTFFPVGSSSYAFVNGIEVVSVPDTLLYCHTGGRGVEVVGEKFLVYVDYSTALEMVHRRNVKRDSVSSSEDFRRMFGMWGAGFNRNGNKNDSMRWRVSVDVGFRYLVRLHFCGIGIKMAENGNTSFSIAINRVVVCTNVDVLAKIEEKHGLFYRNYMVVAKGRKLEGKREITISLQSKDEFIYGHGPLEGFEIFKLSNHDNSLASPNPLLPARDSTTWSFRNLLSVLGSRNTVSAIVLIVISLVNIVVHMLRQTWEANFAEEIKPTNKVTRTCRCFSLSEIYEATKNFDDACVIGKGGFGKVYKGFIDSGTEIVAVKRFKPDSKQGKREFWTEVETLSELRHVNLVSLIGYCNEQEEMIIVYDYMPNGTLADHLYKLARKNSKFSPLSWEERLEICIGAGRGLDYLHTGKGVLHRDVKTSNILLDETFVAKVGDFGLAKTESFSGVQYQDTTNLKGTFGYIDPDYFKTRKLTTKSDTYAFGVVLLEVLCGRPAVDPLAGEDGRSLTHWARDNIIRGEIDRILAPSLSGGIAPDSLKAFLWIVERCLHDEPNKRPTIARVVTNLEFALEQQNGVMSFPDFVPFSGQIQSSRFLVPNERTDFADVLPRNDRMSMSTTPLTMPSSDLQNVTSLSKEQSSRRMDGGEYLYGRKDSRKTLKHRLSRLLPFDAVWRRAKASKKLDIAGISASAPISKHTISKPSSSSSSIYQNRKPSTEGGINELVSTPNFRIFSFSELKVATRNFKPDSLLGEGGFGGVYKGYLKEKSTNGNASESVIAVKKLNHESKQGLKEWLAEITFLGKLSHPNLVRLLGYCLEGQELLLVYEYMQKGSLENHLFRGGQKLSWDIRLKILTDAARGLQYLHTLDAAVIYRDFKTSNILLDGLYNAKLADFGLAKLGPSEEYSHVTTQVIGTYGYAAPEYVATGHLTVKSDVYGFGVVLLEMLTGLRALDYNRPSNQQNLVHWIKPHLNSRKKLMEFMDRHLEGNSPPKSVFKVYQLSKSCLQNDPKARPSMNEVVKILEALEKSPTEPKVRFS